MRAIVYDCEVVKCIPDRGKPRRAGFDYCEGWEDHANMGISVIGCYDYDEGRYRVFLEDNFAEFQALAIRSEIVCGWNSFTFDDKLIEAVLKTKIGEAKSYDLRKLVGIATGDGRYVKGTLSDFGEVNGCGVKSGKGELAPVLWQQGKIGEVIDYCLNDVRITKGLLDLVLLNGFLKTPGGFAANIVKPW